jgi:hypothetical protein
MFRLTMSAAALVLLAMIGGPARAAEPMSADQYEKALGKCQSAESSAKRDDCVKEARDRYESGLGATGPDDKDVAKQVDDRLPDRKLPDGKDLAKDTVSKTVPDKLKQ